VFINQDGVNGVGVPLSATYSYPRPWRQPCFWRAIRPFDIGQDSWFLHVPRYSYVLFSACLLLSSCHGLAWRLDTMFICISKCAILLNLADEHWSYNYMAPMLFLLPRREALPTASTSNDEAQPPGRLLVAYFGTVVGIALLLALMFVIHWSPGSYSSVQN